MAIANETETSAVSEAATSVHQSGNFRFALVALTSLFFMWGFITCLNDILIPYLKNMFELNYAQAMLVQFCFLGLTLLSQSQRVHLWVRLVIKKA